MSETGNPKRKGVAQKESRHWAVRDTVSGAFLPVTELSGSIPRLSELSKDWKVRADTLSKAIKILRAATSISRDAGTPVQFTVEVDPDGASRIITDEPVSMPKAVGHADHGTTDLERALGAARARGRNLVAQILAQPEMLSAEVFARHLNTTRATINTWRQAHQVLGLQGAIRGFRYPAWQIGEDGRPFEALPQIFEALGGSPWAVYRFLVQEHPELDGLSGREALERGRGLESIAVAESVAQAFA